MPRPGCGPPGDDFQIQVCSLAWLRSGDDEARRRFVEDLGSAMERIGFAILVDHGIPPQIWDEAEAKALETFTSIGLEEKMRFRAERYGSVSQGYFPIKETSAIHPDLVEGWVFCRRAFDLAEGADDGPYRESDFWPRAGFEPTFRRLVEHHEELILPIMRSILEYLGCEAGLYDDRLRNTNFGLRLNYYPPIGEAEDRSGAGRLLGHEDVDLFTILPAPKVEGLQVLNREKDRWVRLDPPPGSIILNTGDYMQRITNDRMPSTTHRVSKPRDAALLEVPRLATDGRLRVGRRDPEGPAGLGEPEIRADPSHHLPHAVNQQVLRRRLRGRRVSGDRIEKVSEEP